MNLLLEKMDGCITCKTRRAKKHLLYILSCYRLLLVQRLDFSFPVFLAAPNFISNSASWTGRFRIAKQA